MKLNQSGIDHEINFWRRTVQSDRFKNGWAKNCRTPELRDIVYNFLQTLSPNDAILDVGSGPISIAYGSTAARIVSCDPLSKLYQEILDYPALGLVPPAPIPAEKIADYFGISVNSIPFTCVLISNALDHTKDPLRALDNLLRCVAPAGTLIIQGFVNEATHENFQGFHQINISLRSNKALRIATRDGRKSDFIPASGTVTLAQTERLETGRDWLTYFWQNS